MKVSRDGARRRAATTGKTAETSHTVQVGKTGRTGRTVKTLYIDMDNVLVDFRSGINQLDEHTKAEFKDRLDDVPGIFALMDPMPGAIEAFTRLSTVFDTYILSTAPWVNPSAWSDKLLWVQRYLGDSTESPAYKRLILSHHKNLNDGAFLVDDRLKNGVDRFRGEHIHFGQKPFKTWADVEPYLLDRS